MMIHVQEIKFRGQVVKKFKWKQTDAYTTDFRPIAFLTNVVGNSTQLSEHLRTQVINTPMSAVEREKNTERCCE